MRGKELIITNRTSFNNSVVLFGSALTDVNNVRTAIFKFNFIGDFHNKIIQCSTA